MAEAMRGNIAALLRGIDRYNPENLTTLERYVEMQAKENVYDLEANLAVLKLYQFNPAFFQTQVAVQILLKALTNLPHTDFILCKCLIDSVRLEEEPMMRILHLANLLEMCDFNQFWTVIAESDDVTQGITGFDESIRKYICHVVGITYQKIEKKVLQELLGMIPEPAVTTWISKYGWKEVTGEDGEELVYVANQEESIKTKNITEKITFESVANIMAQHQSYGMR